MRPNPLAQVKESFESREKLVEQLVGMVDKLHGDTKDEVKARLAGLSNKKLLRLYRVEQTVRERFGDRKKLVEHIIEARQKAGLTADESYRDKLASYSKARLLDLTRQKLGEAPKKWTPEQKLRSKRGKKQRERAQAALGKS